MCIGYEQYGSILCNIMPYTTIHCGKIYQKFQNNLLSESINLAHTTGSGTPAGSGTQLYKKETKIIFFLTTNSRTLECDPPRNRFLLSPFEFSYVDQL